MLLWAFLLISVALTVSGRRISTTLQHPNSTDLDLSNRGYKTLAEDSFANLSHLESLNLANNSLKSLPKLIFEKLTNLKYLNLSNNALNAGNFYDNLGSLKTLDISNNSMTSFERGHFFGLTKSANILTNGIKFDFITTTMFENPLIENKDSSKSDGTYRTLSYKSFKAKLCAVAKSFEKIHVVFLKNLNDNKTVFNNDKLGRYWCEDVYVTNGELDLEFRDIATFEKGWYRLDGDDVHTLNLKLNEITEVTKEMLNDLPSRLTKINLSNNGIQKLKRGVMKNSNPIQFLDFAHNQISEIEYGAFDEVNLVDVLRLTHNRLNSTDFLESLPANIKHVQVRNNKITEITPGNFTKFAKPFYLDLGFNQIELVQAHQLRSFVSLERLSLMYNGLKRIEPGFLQDQKNLKKLNLWYNSLTSLDAGVFDGPEELEEINLNVNDLTSIPIGVFSNLNSLKDLDLGINNIQSLRAGCFPREMASLALNRNNISMIEKGTFNLPNLEELLLHGNILEKIDGDMFEGLDKLYKLTLSSNNITKINKGFAKNLKNLSSLDLSENRITELQNGALFGLPKNIETKIFLQDVHVDKIQGGVFDDL